MFLQRILQKKVIAVSVLTFLPVIGASTTSAQTQGPNLERQVFRFEPSASSYLGVQTENVSRDNFARYNLSEPRGVVVTKVLENSPAAQAGLRDNDVIIKFENEPVKSTAKLLRLIQDVAPDQKAKITILRAGSEQEINVTMGKRAETGMQGFRSFPNMENFQMTIPFDFQRQLPPMSQIPQENQTMPFPGENGETLILPGNTGRKLGVSVAPMTEQLGKYFGTNSDKGLLIQNVAEQSAAAKGGFKAGDVILEVDGQAVANQADLIRALNKNSEGEVSVTIIRDKQRQIIKVVPDGKKETPGATTQKSTRFKI